MKRFVFIVFTIACITQGAFAQTNFKWDIIIDSLDANKQELYSKTKLFISEAWKSAQNVIQNDDPDAGVILIKGASKQELYYQMNNHEWTFKYTIRFLIKDNRCRIIVDDVYCFSAWVGINKWPLLPVQNEYPERGYMKTSLNQERYLKVMNMLRDELQGIVDSYIKILRGQSLLDENW